MGWRSEKDKPVAVNHVGVSQISKLRNLPNWQCDSPMWGYPIRQTYALENKTRLLKRPIFLEVENHSLGHHQRPGQWHAAELSR